MTTTKLQAAQRLLSNRKQVLAIMDRLEAEGGTASILLLEEFRILQIEAAELESALADAALPDAAELERLFLLEDPRG